MNIQKHLYRAVGKFWTQEHLPSEANNVLYFPDLLRHILTPMYCALLAEVPDCCCERYGSRVNTCKCWQWTPVSADSDWLTDWLTVLRNTKPFAKRDKCKSLRITAAAICRHFLKGWSWSQDHVVTSVFCWHSNCAGCEVDIDKLCSIRRLLCIISDVLEYVFNCRLSFSVGCGDKRQLSVKVTNGSCQLK